MVPRVSRPGRSFTGAWAYYFHDKRDAAQIERGEGQHTAGRVEWVHVENAAGIEDERAAIGLMIDTARQSKRCEKPVYAFSLGWHPEQRPERAEMIEAARAALKVLEMQDHQAVFVAHNDTAHRHVHVIVNRVHPETLKAANNYRDQQKLSALALEQERAQNRIYCTAREFRANAREMSKASTPRAQEKSPQTQQRPPRSRYVDNTLAECWTRSDGGKSFLTALEAKGWRLARGDRKENVLMAVTPSGRAFAVLRELNKGLLPGQKLKGADVDRKLADLNRELLPSVEQAQRAIAEERPHRAKGREKRQEKARSNGQAERKTVPDARGAFQAASQTPPTEDEAQKRQAQEAERRERFEEWAARQRQRLFSRQLEDRDALHLAHERIREVWENRVWEPHDRRRERTNAQIRAIEERQTQAGFKGWLYRVSGRAEAEREELDALRERRQARARELEVSREAMEAPLRGESAAIKERQEAELQRLERQLAERWEQSWSRADHRANENAHTPDPEREAGKSHQNGGRSRSREP
ncbi:MAG: relaxase/mobilization nuclease domain-containing protein [Nitrospira sp.]|nr:relaxase/mobilization nuclease domain-containing protein [Nitrospira sp.]